MNVISPFDYANYRAYLRDWFLLARRGRGLSSRGFARRAGLGSSGHVHMVIDGRRNLGVKSLERFMNGLRLTGGERLYFRNLVLWNQATTGAERARCEGKLTLLRRLRGANPQIRERLKRLRSEVHALLASVFTNEEATLLAGQLFSAE